MTQNPQAMPDAQGFFGPYGGQLVPPHLKQAMDDILVAYEKISQREDFQQELAHNAAKSDDSNAGTYEDKQYRDAKADGWFSYDLKVNTEADAKNYLSVQYQSADAGRTFSMIVEAIAMVGVDNQ